MAYQATVIPVMIASPSDVTEEREIVRRVIHDWNDVNSEYSQAMLAAVGWDSHSSPELGGRAQDFINSRILRKCDLLIGVFWTRLETPTGDALSGTVEEIERHLEANKPAMIYFSSKPAAPDSIDPVQYAKVKEFQGVLKTRGIIEFYANTQEFEQKISKQLQQCLIQNNYLRGLVSQTKTQGGFGIPGVTVSEPRAEDRLSVDAKELLKAAASKEDGLILKISYLGGLELQVGDRIFGGEGAREGAKWEAALNELESLRLVIQRGNKGQVYELSLQGWEVGDRL